MLCLLSILATLQRIKMKIQARSIITNKNTVGSLARRRVRPRTGSKSMRTSHPYIQSYDHNKQRYTMMRTWYQVTSRCCVVSLVPTTVKPVVTRPQHARRGHETLSYSNEMKMQVILLRDIVVNENGLRGWAHAF